MSDFWVFFQTGLSHVLDWNGYDHILFLIALSLPYGIRDWKRLVVQVSVFTVGHTFSLALSAFELVSAPAELIEFLIPVTIIATGAYRIARPSPRENDHLWWITLVFGIVHGLGFSNYFNAILSGTAQDKLLPLTAFAAGIELAQLVVVTLLLCVRRIAEKTFNFSMRDFNMVAAALVVGVALPILLETTLELINN
ncbi:MAG: HupE/UreJ family protein [Chitinophagaceae bacterium]|nr:MAG: HupE/UreJ family protein [Chitinophagaceae bacterium]